MYDELKHVPVVGSASVASEYGSINPVGCFSDYVGYFEVVPAGKTLTITDVLLNPEDDVTAAHRVNLADEFPRGGSEIFFQFRAQRRATQQAHFLTGYVIQPGHKVITYTLPTPPSGQFMNVSLNGYLPKSWVWWTKATHTRNACSS